MLQYFMYLGTLWHVVESTPGMGSLKQLSVGIRDVWAVDSYGKIAVRRDVTAAMPEGNHWLVLGSDAPGQYYVNYGIVVVSVRISNTNIHYFRVADGSGGFRHVSVGEGGVWAVSSGGTLCRRAGLSDTADTGSGWHMGVTAAWLHISARGNNYFS